MSMSDREYRARTEYEILVNQIAQGIKPIVDAVVHFSDKLFWRTVEMVVGQSHPLFAGLKRYVDVLK